MYTVTLITANWIFSTKHQFKNPMNSRKIGEPISECGKPQLFQLQTILNNSKLYSTLLALFMKIEYILKTETELPWRGKSCHLFYLYFRQMFMKIFRTCQLHIRFTCIVFFSRLYLYLETRACNQKLGYLISTCQNLYIWCEATWQWGCKVTIKSSLFFFNNSEMVFTILLLQIQSVRLVLKSR